MTRAKVSVWYSAKAHWCVGVKGPLLMSPGECRTVVVAWYTTRASANTYAKVLRQALRGHGA